jgi:hypothetical protein
MATRETVSLTLGAEDRASRVIRDVADDAEALDRLDPDVTVSADDRATGDLRTVADRADQVDRLSPNIDVSADTGAAESALKGLTDLAGGLGGLGGLAGGAGIAGAATAMLGMADAAAQAAFDAEAMAAAFGTSIEDASTLQLAFGKAGVEAQDLFDLIGQTSDVLAQQPELIRELGVTARDPIERFRQVVDAVLAVEDGNRKAALAAQLFGEEGRRQVFDLVARYGDLEAAIDSVDESMVKTNADLEAAKEHAQNTAKLADAWKRVANSIGEAVVPVVADATSAVASLIDEEERGLSTAQELAVRQGVVREELFKGSDAAKALELNLALSKQAVDTAFSPAMLTARRDAAVASGAIAGVTDSIETMNTTKPVIDWDLIKLEADALAAQQHLNQVLASGVKIPIFAELDPTQREAVRRQLEALSRPGRSLDPNVTTDQMRRYTDRNGTG